MLFVSSKKESKNCIVKYGITNTADNSEKFYTKKEVIEMAKVTRIIGVYSSSDNSNVVITDEGLKSFVSRLKLSNAIPEGMVVEVVEGNIVLKEFTFKAYTGVVEVPYYISKIMNSCFCYCSLTGIILQDGLTHIGNHAFDSCTDLKSINIPDSVVHIGDFAFFGCKSLKSIIIPNSVEYLGANVFSFCLNLRSVRLPNKCDTINSDCFYSCSSLQSIEIKEGTKKLCSCAFSQCKSLSHIKLPNTLKRLDDCCFCSCDSLRYIEVLSPRLYISKLSFKDSFNLELIKCHYIPAVVDFQFAKLNKNVNIVLSRE